MQCAHNSPTPASLQLTNKLTMTIAHLLVVLTAALVATANPVPRLNTATLLAQDVIDSWREPALYAT